MLTVAAVPGPPWTTLFLDVNSLARHTPWLRPVMTGYAAYGVVLFAGLLLAGWWTARRRNTTTAMVAALWAPLGMLLAVAVNQPIVAGVDEARPYSTLPHILVLATRSTDPSFPSDHATMAGAVTVGLFLVSRRLGALTAVAAVLMAFARVYIGAHYPQDVVAGLALGALVTGIGYLIARRPLTALVRRLEQTPLRPLVTAGVHDDANPAPVHPG
jgi:membrane-associated phospholipid phosphatase